MKLLSSTQIAWAEPWFFLLRIREHRTWWLRGLLALVISVVMFAAMYFFGPQRGVPLMVLVSLGAGLVLVAGMDLPNIQRDITVKDDCIIVGSTAGRGRFTTFALKEIDAVELIRADESPHRWGGMHIEAGDIEFVTAVPAKVSLDTVANILHRLEVPVSLSGWEPADSDTRVTVRDVVEIDADRVSGGLDITPVDEAEPKLMTPVHVTVQVLIALGPLLLALIGAIAGGVYLYQNWSDASVMQKTLVIGGGLAGLVVSFVYLIRIGQFVSNAYGIGVARKRLPLRSDSPFSGNETDLVTVELFDRESWTATIAKSTDFGFLRIDRLSKELVFEGNKNRWRLPLAGISGCRIEESIVGSEGTENPERRYYVVVEARNLAEGNPWEAGMLYTRTETGKDDAESRYARSKLLYAQVAEVLTDQVA